MKKYLPLAAVSLAMLCVACQPSNKSANSESASLETVQQTEIAPNTLSESEKADGWKLLFDGKTTNGWRGVGKETFPDCGWKIENGEIQVIKKADLNGKKSSDIVTVDQYQYFELSFEFKVTPGANSGVKYRVLESEKRKGFAFGPEYQVLDDAQHPDAKLFTSVEG
ncbi:MAG: DUF1080 domain-containing protein, partial [Parabacteroides sp.]|nr:DUF1080 domain-containing protein [Parabacteroides sp.]